VTCALVLGGGGKWGAVQVGMLAALVRHGVRPDLVVGCSIGAVNGAAFAADPTPAGVQRLRDAWLGGASAIVGDPSLGERAKSVVGRRPYIYETTGLEAMVRDLAGDGLIEDLPMRFECVAACIEEASEHWFDHGPVVDAVLASSAIPGLFPAREITGRHFYDGGLVNSIPLDRAVALGATDIYVLQVGRIEQALRPPRRLHEAALVAFEISRRQRFATFLGGLPDGVRVDVLPSGQRLAMTDRRQLAWRTLDDPAEMIDGAERAATDHLAAAEGAE
jgi:NTE family protein